MTIGRVNGELVDDDPRAITRSFFDDLWGDFFGPSESGFWANRDQPSGGLFGPTESGVFAGGYENGKGPLYRATHW